MPQRSEHDQQQRSTFFRALWPDPFPFGYQLNLWSPPAISFWHDTRDGAIRDVRLEGRNEYFGVGIGASTRHEKIRDRDVRFLASDIDSLPAAFVDFDFKDGLTQAHALAFAAKTLPASIIVHTGAGLHLYWLFDQPLRGNSAITAFLAGFKNYVQTLPFGGDIDHKVIEPARVLRVPGSKNYKYKETPTVELIVCNADTRYAPEEFPLPELPPVLPQSKEFYVNPNAGYRQGTRNDLLFRWACSYLRRFGATSMDHMLSLAAAHNGYVNEPPLGEREVFTTIRSAWKTWENKNNREFLENLNDAQALTGLKGWLNGTND